MVMFDLRMLRGAVMPFDAKITACESESHHPLYCTHQSRHLMVEHFLLDGLIGTEELYRYFFSK